MGLYYLIFQIRHSIRTRIDFLILKQVHVRERSKSIIKYYIWIPNANLVKWTWAYIMFLLHFILTCVGLRYIFSSNQIVHKILFSPCFGLQTYYLIDFSINPLKCLWSPKTKAKQKLKNDLIWQKICLVGAILHNF